MAQFFFGCEMRKLQVRERGEPGGRVVETAEREREREREREGGW